MRKTDPRVIRTRQMLRDALIATILEKGYDATNIQDITERAGLRRATFYLHYRDKEELLFTVLHQTLDELMQQMPTASQNILTAETERAEQLITFYHVQKHADLYRAVLSGQGAAEITRNIREYLAARIRAKCKVEHLEADESIPIEVLANYLTAVRLNMIIWWLETNMPYTPEQMADMCTRLLLSGAGRVLNRSGEGDADRAKTTLQPVS